MPKIPSNSTKTKKKSIGKTTPPSLEEFDRWVTSLSDLDKMNFVTLINLPNAIEVVAKLPEGEYRNRAITGLAIRYAISKIGEENAKD
jgi:hypothetical protein